MAIEILRFKVTGVSPLLMHNPEVMQMPKGKSNKAKGEKVWIPPPKMEAKWGAYIMPNGQLYIPGSVPRAALLYSCKGKTAGKMSLRSLLSATAFVPEDKLPLVYPKTGKPIKKYEIDIRRAVIQRASIMRARPLIPEWQTTVAMECDDDFATPDIIETIMHLSGKIAGWLDFRPQKSGTYGRFNVELLK